MAAKFDVVITAPEKFRTENGKQSLEYHFLSDIDIQIFLFQVYNNSETDIICNPHISNGVMYRVYVNEIEETEFIVRARETVSFRLAIAPNGLDTSIRNAEFFVDVRQMEGGWQV